LRAYLVRTIDDHDLVGIYVAKSREQLQWLVDECINVDLCEYAPMPAGGIQWTDPAINIPVPESDDPDEDPNPGPFLPWSGATETDSWRPFLYEVIKRWKPLYNKGDDPDLPLTPRPRPVLRVVKEDEP
jgi:hypothetical protein